MEHCLSNLWINVNFFVMYVGCSALNCCLCAFVSLRLGKAELYHSSVVVLGIKMKPKHRPDSLKWLTHNENWKKEPTFADNSRCDELCGSLNHYLDLFTLTIFYCLRDIWHLQMVHLRVLCSRLNHIITFSSLDL